MSIEEKAQEYIEDIISSWEIDPKATKNISRRDLEDIDVDDFVVALEDALQQQFPENAIIVKKLPHDIQVSKR